MERFSRSFDIMMMSYRILLRDKELVVLPLCSSTCTGGSSAGEPQLRTSLTEGHGIHRVESASR